ncbi:hypothetical protein MJO28_016807, partial [Puccinia striiformis f. sp. tritici]
WVSGQPAKAPSTCPYPRQRVSSQTAGKTWVAPTLQATRRQTQALLERGQGPLTTSAGKLPAKRLTPTHSSLLRPRPPPSIDWIVITSSTHMTLTAIEGI